MTLGDALALVGLALAWLLYQLQRAMEARRDRDAALAVLRAARDGIRPWGELYFGEGYSEERARARAQQDYDWIMEKNHGQVFQVPAEPLNPLIEGPAAGSLIGAETIQAANIAIWQIGVFNQLVRRQTDFNARHLVEFTDDDLPDTRRSALAQAAYVQSVMLHANGIGDAEWYANLKRALEQNIRELVGRRWWRRWSLALAVVLLVGALVAVAWPNL